MAYKEEGKTCFGLRYRNWIWVATSRAQTLILIEMCYFIIIWLIRSWPSWRRTCRSRRCSSAHPRSSHIWERKKFVTEKKWNVRKIAHHRSHLRKSLSMGKNETWERLHKTHLRKIPSEMQVAPRYNCWHCCHCWHCWHCWHCLTLFDTVDMTYKGGVQIIKMEIFNGICH